MGGIGSRLYIYMPHVVMIMSIKNVAPYHISILKQLYRICILFKISKFKRQELYCT